MGKFVEENLGSGEVIIGGLIALVTVPVVVASMFSKSTGFMSSFEGILAVCAVLLIGWPFIARKSTELVVTDRRFVAKYGLVSTHSIEIRFDKIETVRVSQSLLGKMLNYGDIVVTGTGSTFDPIRNVADAMKFRMALNQAMDAPKSALQSPA